MEKDGYAWAVPVMRLGYAGRGLVYLVVASFSIWAIWQGGEAKGTATALAQLETTWWGTAVLLLIFIGMLAYALWRFVDAAFDLEEYGPGSEGIAARVGIAFTALFHVALGAIAFALLFGDGTGLGSGGAGETGGAGGAGGAGGEGSGATSSIPAAIASIMALPAGRLIVGAFGLLVMGAGLYYLRKGFKAAYLGRLRANRFTERFNGVLRAGVAAQGTVVVVIGVLLLLAAVRADPSEAGATGAAFGWLSERAYGQIIVTVICLGLLAFSLFCFVNAAFRTVPKVSDDAVETLATQIEDAAKRH